MILSHICMSAENIVNCFCGPFNMDQISISISSALRLLVFGTWFSERICFLHFRNYAKVLDNPEANSPTSPTITVSELPQKVLESLFKVPKSPHYEPTTMNWRNVAKKLQSLGPGFDACSSSVAEPQQNTCGNHH